MKEQTPLVKGGQGRTAEAVTESVFMALVPAMVMVAYFVVVSICLKQCESTKPIGAAAAWIDTREPMPRDDHAVTDDATRVTGWQKTAAHLEPDFAPARRSDSFLTGGDS